MGIIQDFINFRKTKYAPMVVVSTRSESGSSTGIDESDVVGAIAHCIGQNMGKLTPQVIRKDAKGLTVKDVSMQGLGYKEILMYLNGEITLDEAVYRIKRDSRHFAKRQLTWFKREKEVIWLNKYDFDDDLNKVLDFSLKVLKDKSII